MPKEKTTRVMINIPSEQFQTLEEARLEITGIKLSRSKFILYLALRGLYELTKQLIEKGEKESEKI